MAKIENNKVAVVETQSRWVSPVFWGAIITSTIGLLSAMGFWAWVGVTQDFAVQVGGALITVISVVLTGANNPTDANKF